MSSEWLEADVIAEQARRAHCSNKQHGEDGHKCVGEMTVKPGCIFLSCKLCGTEERGIEEALWELDTIGRENNPHEQEEPAPPEGGYVESTGDEPF